MSVDIDLFTDLPYKTVDYNLITAALKKYFPFVELPGVDLVGFGKSYLIGKHATDAIKLDVYYTDEFIRPIVQEDGVRMAGVEEIAAMKIEVVQQGGRQKDFWDIHEILGSALTIPDMIMLHEERYPYGHDASLIMEKLTDFSLADEDFTPIGLKGQHWELIKYELANMVAACQ